MGVENHKVSIIRIAELIKHPNADSLSIVQIGGYQVVVKTDDYKVGDLAYYIPPDSVVPESPEFAFLWADLGANDGQPIPEKKRRITVRRFRKEWSEGLLMPLSLDLADALSGGYTAALEGMDIAEFLGIKHYEPPEDDEDNEPSPEKGRKQRPKWPRSFRGWFFLLLRWVSFGKIERNGQSDGPDENPPVDYRPVYDVDAYKNFRGAFEPGEMVVVTEKIHGSNARYTFDNGHMYAGSRKFWKAERATGCIWRRVLAQHPWISQWCEANPGYTIYGEVVPNQTGYNYGCVNGETKFFVFDVRKPDGTWMNENELYTDPVISDHRVPHYGIMPWDEAKIIALASGSSTAVGAQHIREGVVVRPVVAREIRNLGRLQLKIVSNVFLEKDNK